MSNSRKGNSLDKQLKIFEYDGSDSEDSGDEITNLDFQKQYATNS